MSIFSIIIDVLLIATLVAFVVMFSRQGFMVTIYRIGKMWLSLFCSLFLGPTVGNWFQTLFVKDTFFNGIFNTLTGIVKDNPNGYNLSQLFENLPGGLIRILEHYGMSLPELESIYGPATEADTEILQALALRISEPCAAAVSDVVAHIVCFLVPMILMWWLKLQVEKRQIAAFRYIDHVVGFVMGLAIGYCAIWGISLVLHTGFQIVMAYDAHSLVVDVYEKSYIFRFLTEFNAFGAIREMISGI